MVRHFGATLALAAWSCAAPANAQDFYAGKQITIIVGAGPGGGYDLQARIAARYLAQHIPGNPTIIVQNIPSRIAAANTFSVQRRRTAPPLRCFSAASCSPS